MRRWMLLFSFNYMNMERTTTVKRAADRIRRHPMLQEVPFETILDYLVDFIQLMGCPALYEEKIAVIAVSDYRAALPCDYVSMIQVRTAKKKDSFNPNDPYMVERGEHAVYRYSTDSFHFTSAKPGTGRGGTDLTYKIQGGVIYTSTKDDPIEIAYNAMSVDGEGYPLIPDNASFLRAFEAYVKKQRFQILFDKGDIPTAVLQQALQDYAWAAADCEAEFRRLTPDQAESIANIWNNLIVRANEHNHGFMNAGSKEYITLQP